MGVGVLTGGVHARCVWLCVRRCACGARANRERRRLNQERWRERGPGVVVGRSCKHADGHRRTPGSKSHEHDGIAPCSARLR